MPVEPNIEQLRRAAFLADSATAELTAMLPFTEARQARAGDVLLRQGEPASTTFSRGRPFVRTSFTAPSSSTKT